MGILTDIVDEAAAVADPNRAAGPGTEGFLRTFPGTNVVAGASDAVDLVTGNPNSPNPVVGGAVSTGRQFDNVPGGGFADNAIHFGTNAARDATGGASRVVDNVVSSIPWIPIAAFLGLLVVLNAFSRGAGEGLTS